MLLPPERAEAEGRIHIEVEQGRGDVLETRQSDLGPCGRASTTDTRGEPYQCINVGDGRRSDRVERGVAGHGDPATSVRHRRFGVVH